MLERAELISPRISFPYPACVGRLTLAALIDHVTALDVIALLGVVIRVGFTLFHLEGGQ